MFWVLLFPIILATLLAFTYSNIFSSKDFTAIEVAVVENDSIAFNKMLHELEQGDDPILSIAYVSDEEATKLLADGAVEGIVAMVGDNVQLTVISRGINQSILKTLLDNFTQTRAAIQAVSYIDENLIDGEKANPLVHFYYVLLAMACLFGAYFGIRCIEEIQPNQSTKGVRRSMAPTNTLRIFAYEFLASLLVHIMLMLIVLAYMMLILNLDLGTKIPAIILAVAASSLLGLSIGVFIAALVPKGEKVSSPIFSAFAIFSCLFAGLMGGYEAKYILESGMPFLRYINPAALISDSFYSLYIFDTYDRFVTTIILILLMSSICIIGASLIIRRQKYASI